MKRRVVRKGDTTTTAGRVLTGGSKARDRYREIACLGDLVFCPVCKTTGIIIEGYNSWLIHKRPVALHDHLVKCLCPIGANRLIASPDASSVDV